MSNYKYTVNEEFFDVKNNNSAYIAGFLTADGCVHKRRRNSMLLSIILNPKDMSILEHIKSELKFTGKIRTYTDFDPRRNKTYNKCAMVIYNEYLCQSLINNWYIVPRKTGYEKLPILNDECFYAYMRGLLDGDGSVGNKSGHSIITRIFSASRPFLEEISDRAKMGKIYLGKTCYEWRLETRDSLIFRDLIYADGGFSLQRKKDRMFMVDRVFGSFAPKDDQIIKDSLSKEKPLQFKEIGVLLGRNQESVAKRAEELGLYKRVKLRRFTKAEVGYIKSQIDPKNKLECVDRLSKELNINPSSMRWKVYSLCAQ